MIPRVTQSRATPARRRSSGAFLGRSRRADSAPRYDSEEIDVLTVEPNWREPVKLRVINQTLIHEALDTSEERLGTRPRPLYGLQFTSRALHARGTAYVRRVLDLAQEKPFGVPLWMAQTKLTADVAANATTLTVDSIEFSLWEAIQPYAILWRDFETWEIVKLRELDDDNVTIRLENGTRNAWVAGDRIIPLLYGKLLRNPHTQLTDERGELEVDFEERFLLGIESRREATLPPVTDVPSEIEMSECNDIITFRFDASHDPGIGGQRCWVVEAKVGENGAWGDFAILRGDPPVSGRYFELQIDNVWDGDFYIRAYNYDEIRFNGRYYGTTTQNPDPPDVLPPDITVSNTTLVATIDPLLGTNPSDLQRFSGFPKPQNNDEGPYISPDEVYRTPASLVQYDDVTGWDGVPCLLTISHDDPDVTIRWTRDDTNPSLAVANPGNLDGFANNAGFYRDDTLLIIRARAFKNGCQSAQRIIVCEKTTEIFSQTVMRAYSGNGGYTCENRRYARSTNSGLGLPTDCQESSGYPGNHPQCGGNDLGFALLDACGSGVIGNWGGAGERPLNIAEKTGFSVLNYVAEDPPGGCGITWSDGDYVYQASVQYFVEATFTRPAGYNSLPHPYYYAFARVQCRVRANSFDGQFYYMNAAGAIVSTITSPKAAIDQATYPLFGVGGVSTGMQNALDEAVDGLGVVVACQEQFGAITTAFWNNAWLIITRYAPSTYEDCAPE